MEYGKLCITFEIHGKKSFCFSPGFIEIRPCTISWIYRYMNIVLHFGLMEMRHCKTSWIIGYWTLYYILDSLNRPLYDILYSYQLNVVLHPRCWKIETSKKIMKRRKLDLYFILNSCKFDILQKFLMLTFSTVNFCGADNG